MKIQITHDHVFIEDESPADASILVDYSSVQRCARCSTILFIGELGPTSCIEIQCRKCKLKNVFLEGGKK